MASLDVLVKVITPISMNCPKCLDQ